MKYRFIEAQRTQSAVVTLCRVLGVSRSAYYQWRHTPESPQQHRRRALLGHIASIYQTNKRVYGSPRIHQELKSQGVTVGKNTVARLMRANGIRSRVSRRYVATTDARHCRPIAPNRLNRQFTAPAPNQRWVSDVTFVRTGEGALYLATVLDLFSRMIVGWSMSHRNDTSLAMQALQAALNNRGNPEGVLVHSDRGAPYASAEYQQLLNKSGLICSMSRTGNCWDNAVMESFYHSLKTEQLNFVRPRTRADARAHVFDYIELFYNGRRRHSSLGYVSPREFEAKTCFN